MLKELNQCSEWRKIFGPENKRMKDRELILRFFALFFNFTNYKKPYKEFLNDFMGERKHLPKKDQNKFSELFVSTIKIVYENVGTRAFRIEGNRINAAFFEAIMVGIATQIKSGKKLTKKTITGAYDNLLKNEEFLAACQTGTSDEKKVSLRVNKAIDEFKVK